MLAQQKALLAMAQQELQVVELENRLVQAEQQRGETLSQTRQQALELISQSYEIII